MHKCQGMAIRTTAGAAEQLWQHWELFPQAVGLPTFPWSTRCPMYTGLQTSSHSGFSAAAAFLVPRHIPVSPAYEKRMWVASRKSGGCVLVRMPSRTSDRQRPRAKRGCIGDVRGFRAWHCMFGQIALCLPLHTWALARQLRLLRDGGEDKDLPCCFLFSVSFCKLRS